MQSAGNRSFGDLLDEQDENLKKDREELQSLLGDEEKGDRDAFELTQTNQTEAPTQLSTNPFDPIPTNKMQGKRDDDSDDYQVYLPQVEGGPNGLSFGQKALGEVLKFTFAAVPPYLLGQDEILGQYLSQVPDVYNDMLKMIMFPTNVVINQMIEALVYKENPLDGLRRIGVGHAGFGAVKEATTRMAFIGLVALGAYGAHAVIQAKTHEMLYSDNDQLRTLGLVLTEDAFKIPLFGLTGYLFEEILYRQIGMRLWECCSPSKEAKITNQDLNLVQKTLDYAVQFFLTTSMTESMLYYINIFSQDPIGHDPRFQALLWLINNLTTLRVGRYLASEPDPIDALAPIAPTITYSDDPDEVIVETSTKCESRGKSLAVLGIMAVGFYGGAYLFNRVTCGIADSYGSEICTVDTLENRLIRDAAMVAIPAGIEYGAKVLFPAIKTGVTKCLSSLFSSRGDRLRSCEPPPGMREPDLINAEELTETNKSTFKRF